MRFLVTYHHTRGSIFLSNNQSPLSRLPDKYPLVLTLLAESSSAMRDTSRLLDADEAAKTENRDNDGEMGVSLGEIRVRRAEMKHEQGEIEVRPDEITVRPDEIAVGPDEIAVRADEMTVEVDEMDYRGGRNGTREAETRLRACARHKDYIEINLYKSKTPQTWGYVGCEAKGAKVVRKDRRFLGSQFKFCLTF